MKIQRSLDFVCQPSNRRPVVLLYGNNVALQQFYLTCLRASFPDLSYAPIDSAKQLAVVAAPSLFDEEGGGKLIYLANAGERDLAPLQTFVENPSRTHVLIIASSLATKTKLVSYFLAHKNHAALPCYDLRSHELKGFISHAAAKRTVNLTDEALLYLAETFVAYPHLLLSELDKLSLYQIHQREPINLKTVQSLMSFNNQLNLDSLIQAVLLGNVPLLLKSLSPVLIEDEFILIIRCLIKNYCQLFEILTHLQQKISFSEAFGQVSPPVFFQLKPLFAQAVERWSLGQCATVLEHLLLLEKAYKNQEINWSNIQAELLRITQKAPLAERAA